MTTQTPQRPAELLPCPFNRGQVWQNPDGILSLIIDVRHKPSGFDVCYVSEAGQFGWFNDERLDIINNIELIVTRPAPAPIDLETVAISLWHRFAPDNHETWEDELEKVIYRLAAKECCPSEGFLTAQPTDDRIELARAALEHAKAQIRHPDQLIDEAIERLSK